MIINCNQLIVGITINNDKKALSMGGIKYVTTVLIHVT